MDEESLRKDLQAAMRARDQRRVDILRAVMTSAKNLKVEKRAESVAEAEIVGIFRKELKKRDDIIEFAEKGGRDEIAAEARKEKEVLATFLPSQLTGDELAGIVRSLAAEIGSSEIGPLMKELGKRHGGRYDGKEASTLIRGLGGD